MNYVASLILTGVAFCISFMVMIYGWGLEPQSWPWIIGGTIIAVLVAGIGRILLDQGG